MTEETNYVEQLVARKGEKFKDPQFIAKSKLESDDYISQLEEQLKELREDVPKEDYSKQLLEELKKAKPDPTSTTQTKSESRETDILSLIDEQMTKREREALAKQNLTEVYGSLEKEHGTEVDGFLKKKAGELGVSVDRLKEIGAESPAAFRALVGVKEPTQPVLTKSSVRSEALPNTTSGDRNMAYYQDLRRTNKKLYFSPATQQQMMKDRKALGDKFY